MTPPPFTHRRSPRLAAPEASDAAATAGAQTKKDVPASTTSTTPSSKQSHRRSPRLAAAVTCDAVTATAGDQTKREAQPRSSALPWNNTGFDPYTSSLSLSSAPFLPPGGAMLTHSSATCNDSTVVGHSFASGSVAVAGQDKLSVSSMETNDTHANANGSHSLVTPHCNTLTAMGAPSLLKQQQEPAASSIVRQQAPMQTKLSTVTPHEHEASMALAALTMASKKRKAASSADGNEPQQPASAGAARPQVHFKPIFKANDAFPGKLHAMLMEVTREAPKLVKWVNGGEAFVLTDPKSRELGKYLYKYWNHSNYSSLQRQLNMYGWNKKTDGKLKGAFYNRHFHRDIRKSDLGSIRRRQTDRRPVSTRSTRAAAAAAAATVGSRSPYSLGSGTKPIEMLTAGNDGVEHVKEPKKLSSVGSDYLVPDEGSKKRTAARTVILESASRSEQGNKSPACGIDTRQTTSLASVVEEQSVPLLHTKPRVLLAEVKQRSRRSPRLSSTSEEQGMQDVIRQVSVSIIMQDDGMKGSANESRFETEQEVSTSEAMNVAHPFKSPRKAHMKPICFVPPLPGSPIVFDDSALPPLVTENGQASSARIIGGVETDETATIATGNAFRLICTSPLEAPSFYSSTAVAPDILGTKLRPSPVECATVLAERASPLVAVERDRTPASGVLTPLPLDAHASPSSIFPLFAGLSAALSLSPAGHGGDGENGSLSLDAQELFPSESSS